MKVRIAGRGRAGSSLAQALGVLDGWQVALVPHADASAEGVDLLVLAVPDAAIVHVAASTEPVPSTVVAHLAGSLTLDVLAPHQRRASLHPLVPLANGELGKELLVGAWYATAGDELVKRVVDALRGRSFEVADEHRAAYHAAACIAANHVIALLAQARRVGEAVGVPLEAYLELARRNFDNAAVLGPEAALTGPASRGDTATIARHLAALPEDERTLYAVLAEACRAIGLSR